MESHPLYRLDAEKIESGLKNVADCLTKRKPCLGILNVYVLSKDSAVIVEGVECGSRLEKLSGNNERLIDGRCLLNFTLEARELTYNLISIVTRQGSDDISLAGSLYACGISLSKYGTDSRISVHEIRRRVAVKVKHLLPGEDDVLLPAGLDVSIDNSTETDLLGNLVDFLLAHVLAAKLRILDDNLTCLVHSSIEQVLEKNDIALSC